MVVQKMKGESFITTTSKKMIHIYLVYMISIYILEIVTEVVRMTDAMIQKEMKKLNATM